MKRITWAVMLALTFSVPVAAGLIRSADVQVSIAGNETTAADIADALSLKVWKFKVSFPDKANTLGIRVAVKDEGKEPKKLFETIVHRHPDERGPERDVPVLLVVHPTGNMRGETLVTARNLRFFTKALGSQTQNVNGNPFYKSSGITIYGSSHAAPDKVFTLMSSDVPKRELTVSFWQYIDDAKE